jgi:uncharacterized membrane protein
MKPKTVAIMALIALGVVVGYDQYRQRKSG